MGDITNAFVMKIPYPVDAHKAEKAIFDNVHIDNIGIVTVLLSDFHFRSSLLSIWTVSYTSWIVFGFLAILILSRMLFRPRPPNTAFAIYRASSSFSIPSLLSKSAIVLIPRLCARKGNIFQICQIVALRYRLDCSQ